MQEYTLSEAFAHHQTVDIPAFSGKLDVSWNPEAQVTQWGGLAYFVSYLKTSGLFERLVEDAPFHYTSPNAPKVRDVEKRGLRYLFKIRRTKTVLSLFRRHENGQDWIDAGAGWEAKEAMIQLGGNRAKGLLPEPLALID